MPNGNRKTNAGFGIEPHRMIVKEYRLLSRVAFWVILTCIVLKPTGATALPDSRDAPPFYQVERVADGLAGVDRLHSQDTDSYRDVSGETLAGSVTEEGDGRAIRLEFWALAALALVAFAAGTVDAVA